MAIGYIMVDAPHSALNNSGIDASERTENIVRVKAIRKGKEIYPYISAQALRYWWRMTLMEKFGWELSPVERGDKIAFTKANPFKYPDDDIFGYMRALKERNVDKTVTRVSPLKCSPLVSITSFNPVSDYGVMSRHEGDPVPYEHEFYSVVFQGIFSLDLTRTGVFYLISQAGFRNIIESEIEEDNELRESIKRSGAIRDGNVYVLPKDVRAKRAADTIRALGFIYGGARHTLHLTDVRPRLVILAVIEGGNHLFMNLAYENNGQIEFNFAGLKEILVDYSDIIISDIFVGIQSGFLNDLDIKFRSEFEDFNLDGRRVIIVTPRKAINSFADVVKKIF
jgi:CRISPR-associated protein Cst2